MVDYLSGVRTIKQIIHCISTIQTNSPPFPADNPPSRQGLGRTGSCLSFCQNDKLVIYTPLFPQETRPRADTMSERAFPDAFRKHGLKAKRMFTRQPDTMQADGQTERQQTAAEGDRITRFVHPPAANNQKRRAGKNGLNPLRPGWQPVPGEVATRAHHGKHRSLPRPEALSTVAGRASQAAFRLSTVHKLAVGRVFLHKDKHPSDRPRPTDCPRRGLSADKRNIRRGQRTTNCKIRPSDRRHPLLFTGITRTFARNNQTDCVMKDNLIRFDWAMKMKAPGMPIESIVQCTQLSTEEILGLEG